MNNNLVIGINCPVLPDGTITYDGNVAVVRNGKPFVALAEERISRNKYDGDYKNSLNYILNRYKIDLNSIEAIALCSFAQPMLDNDELPITLKKVYKDFIDMNIPLYYIKSHHEAHAFAAASQCSFEEAIIAVLDHTGNILDSNVDNFLEKNPAEQTSYYLLRNGEIKLIERDHDKGGNTGYGRVYGDVTCYLGFNSYRESGKTMGLASFGDPEVFSTYSLFTPDEDNRELSCLTDETFCEDNTKDINKWFERKGIKIPDARSDGLIRPFDMHLAAWVQNQLQVSIARRLKGLMNKYSVKNLCLSGGVAMNSVLNTYLQEVLNINVFIPPSPGDAGIALGAVAKYLSNKNNALPRFGSNPYLGPNYEIAEIKEAIDKESSSIVVKECKNVAQEAAEALFNNKIIGWFQGRSEYGPRALGNRSILASPCNSWIKEILNNQVKLREWFRPYAPVVRLEDAGLYFDNKYPVPHMMQVAHVKNKARMDIPACIHVDGTARLQTVTAESNKLFYKLIGAFGDLSGVPVVLNTSFNLAGMPIVESPLDAIQCFKSAIGIDMLFIGNFLITKK